MFESLSNCNYQSHFMIVSFAQSLEQNTEIQQPGESLNVCKSNVPAYKPHTEEGAQSPCLQKQFAGSQVS
jgi:hypothetical protein